MTKPITRPGDQFASEYAWCFNRTGAALVAGQVVMLDFARTQTETTNSTPGSESSSMANVTPCTQAGVDAGFPVYVADEAIADNALGRFLIKGIREVAVLDDDVSTTDIDIGDPVAILVSESAVAVQAKAAADHRQLGIALEDAAADSTNTDRAIDASSHLRRILWTGGEPVNGVTIDG